MAQWRLLENPKLEVIQNAVSAHICTWWWLPLSVSENLFKRCVESVSPVRLRFNFWAPSSWSCKTFFYYLLVYLIVCVYIHVYALCVQVHMCIYRYTWRPKDNLGHHPTAVLHLVLFETGSHWPVTHLSRLEWPDNEPRGSTFSMLPVKVHVTTPSFSLDSRGPNSGPHTHTVSTLPTECSQPCFLSWFVLVFCLF